MGDLIQLPIRHDPWMTKQELARYWRCSPRSIERYVHQGLPSEWINGRRFFKLQAATRWMEDRQCRESAAQAVV